MGHRIAFLGAARNVTGSSYLVESDGYSVLVDCGMYQERELRTRNWDAFRFKPADLNAVLLTHAHLDHCGLLPKLVREGFKGKIYATPATADIAEIVLLDSARIQLEDVAQKERRHARQGRKGPHPLVPLYTVEDVQACVSRFDTHGYEKPFALCDHVRASFHDAGHILGSSMIRLELAAGDAKRTLIFSGDIGRWDSPIIEDPSVFDEADYVVTESTYGDRRHRDRETIPEVLASVVNGTFEAGGNVVIPSFAVERSQELLYYLSELLHAGRIPKADVFLDSPMAVKVTEVFNRHPGLFDDATRSMIRDGRHPCDFPGLQMTRTVEESKAIKHVEHPCIIIAGSGMCTGGRVKHHLVNNIDREESTVLFIGYQASGTLGRIILEKTPKVRILGAEYDVKAKIAKLNGFSAHADRDELMRWLNGLKRPPRGVFVTHGEEDSAEAFAAHVKEKTGWPTQVPEYGERMELT